MFLQSEPVFASDWPFLIVAAIVILAGFLYYQKVKKDQAELKAAEHDPRSHVVNDTNYNIAREGIDGHRNEGLSKAEAKRAVETLKETEQVPSREEFEELSKDLS